MADIVDLSSLGHMRCRMIDFRIFVSMWCGRNLSRTCFGNSCCAMSSNVESSSISSNYCKSLSLGLCDNVKSCVYVVEEDCRTAVWTYQQGNDALNSSNLDKFLFSIGRNPSYVNFEADTVVGKDNPPDLAAFVPAEVPQLPEAVKTAGHVPEQHRAPWEKRIIHIQESDNPSRGTQKAKEKPRRSGDVLSEATDVRKFIKELIDKTSSAVLSEISKKLKDELRILVESSVLDGVKKHISSDLETSAMILKNAAYTQGFQAGIESRSLRR